MVISAIKIFFTSTKSYFSSRMTQKAAQIQISNLFAWVERSEFSISRGIEFQWMRVERWMIPAENNV